jgi:hypothetical protein
VGASKELYKVVHLIGIGYFIPNRKSETEEVRNMNLILLNA